MPYRDLARRESLASRSIGIGAEILASSVVRRNSIGPVHVGSGGATKKTSLEQEAKAGLLVGSVVSGLLHRLHVVVVMMVVVMAVMMTMVVMMTMMLRHRGRIRARHADSRHRESNCNRKPESREEGLLHGSFPFFAGRY
ncbi:hypothetical protein [Mesorhizobium sp. 113-3-9]|uniref:hypothetical protein n=1 Tax=Mesorhizobium sp. 113-3-9 TaxID=2744517 RepID=UPI001927EC81|nr:hypothetical protein [Mesorhizobium sp. 113-3-9]